MHRLPRPMHRLPRRMYRPATPVPQLPVYWIPTLVVVASIAVYTSAFVS